MMTKTIFILWLAANHSDQAIDRAKPMAQFQTAAQCNLAAAVTTYNIKGHAFCLADGVQPRG